MTVTQRRNRAAATTSIEDPRTGVESGIKVTCDFCHIDITNTVRFKCANEHCRDIDICPSCFCEGKEGQKHKATHDYMVEEPLTTPIFDADWGADEEILLVSGLITHGLGNWLEVSGHVGTRTKEECEKHYCETYLGCTIEGEPLEAEVEQDVASRKRPFMPPMSKQIDLDPDEWQRRKKQRIEEMRRPQALPPPSGPLVSAPTNHEVAGFMPGRLEFEHEVENDAEMAVKDMDFGLVWKYGGDEQPAAKVTKPVEQEEEEEEESSDEEDDKTKVKAEKPEPKPDKGKGKAKAAEDPALDIEDEDELEVKLALLDIYFTKLDKREEAKELIFDRGLTEYKKIQAAERKRPKDERELINRFKVFAKLQTAMDFEVLSEGLVFEQHLRRRIAELQEYRRVGVTTAFEAETYDQQKATRAGYRPLLPRDRPEPVVSGARVNAGQHRFLHGIAGTPPPPGAKIGHEPIARPSQSNRRIATPLNLANAASLDLLSLDEQALCSQLRILPKPYLCIKDEYIRENERRRGGLKRRDARKMLNIDVNKSGKIFDFLVSTGALRLAYDPAARPRANGLASVPPPNGANGANVGGVGVKANGALGAEGARPGLVEVRLHENAAQY